VADLSITGPISAPDPSLAAHVATKNYVDTTRGQTTSNLRTANYTLSLSDAGRVVEMNATAGTFVTVPTNATVAFPLGTVIRVRKIGTGNVTVSGAGGVVINWASTFVVSVQYTLAELHKRGPDLWVGVLLGS
jgi:hypothetical protein